MTRQDQTITRFYSAILFAVFLLIWERAAGSGLISSTFFPPPTEILKSLLKLGRSGYLLSATSATLLRFSGGLIVGSVTGALLGLIMGWWPRLYFLLDPFVAALYPIPKTAIFPLLMIIFGLGEGSKFAAVVLSSFFPMLLTSLVGVQQINKVYFEVGQNYGARGMKVLTHILLPGSLPSLMTGLQLSANMAFIIVISVEIVSAKTGLGVLLWFGWQTFRVSEIYAVLVVISMLGVLFNYLLRRLSKAFIPWMGG